LLFLLRIAITINGTTQLISFFQEGAMAAKGRGGGKTPGKVVELVQKAVAEKSLRAVSKETGVGIAVLSRYSQGIGEPSQATLEKLADYFAVTVPFLRGDQVQPVVKNTNENSLALVLASIDLDLFKREKHSIMEKGIQNLFRDIALLVLSLPEEYYDEKLLSNCKEIAREIVAEIL
jgi:transcriptional regulator with XRE-family HTH domain